MVNRGASQGCITCRQRRVKCDQNQPHCKTCLRLGRECAGYGKKRLVVRFKDETGRLFKNPSDQRTRTSDKTLARSLPAPMKMNTTPTSTSLATSVPHHHKPILVSPQIPQQDVALSFFLTYVTGIGRNLESSRGFMELVRPAYAVEHVNSALTTAVNAVAALLWFLLRRSSLSMIQPTCLLNKALLRLQKAIGDPEERGRDATVLAALVLQAYETISAVLGQRRADGKHREGALALLLHRRGGAKISKYHGSLLGNILHAKVSLCVREKKSFPVHELDWAQTEVFPYIPVNPSSLLDVIGISVANLQSQFLQPIPFQRQMSHSELELGVQQVQTLEDQLWLWQQNIPHHWHPKRVAGEKYIDSSIVMYQNACEVYPTLQIANIWSVWCVYRLILIRIKLRLLAVSRNLSPDQSCAAEEYKHADKVVDSTEYVGEALELIERLCHSVPFYLGSRMFPAILSDMENSELTFPSYHDLQPTDDAFLEYLRSDCYVSRVDHSRHVVLHGALHIASILAYLVGLSAETHGLQIPQIFSHEQKIWILRQFLRSVYLLRLIPEAEASLLDASCSDGAAETISSDAGILKVEAIASNIRQRLWTISIF